MITNGSLKFALCSLICDHKKILVTGEVGFVGAHLVRRLTDNGAEVVGVDKLPDYLFPS